MAAPGVTPLSRMNTKTVRNPMTLMNAPSAHWNGERIKAALYAVNHSKLRYPVLVLTLLLLATVAITARQLALGILSDIQPVIEMLEIPL
jgi:hypothetical protein